MAADGTYGATAAIRKLQAMSARLNDLSPVQIAIKREGEREVSEAFRNQRSPAGKQWRATQHGGPADPEGHLQAQIEVVVDGKHRVMFTGPTWLRAWMSGGTHDGKSGRPPKRNPLPLEKDGSGRYALNPRMSKFVVKTVRDHVTGAR